MYHNYAEILKYKHKYYDTLHVKFEQVTGRAWHRLTAASNNVRQD